MRAGQCFEAGQRAAAPAWEARLNSLAQPASLLSDPVKMRQLWEGLRRERPELELDELACLLAKKAGRDNWPDARFLRKLLENYASYPDTVFVSSVLWGIFRSGVPEPLLEALFQEFEGQVCASPPRGFSTAQVAADLLAATSLAFRERYIETILERYGPGSAVHYKIEGQDCTFLTDRWLAQVALATLPVERRAMYQRRLLGLFPQ